MPRNSDIVFPAPAGINRRLSSGLRRADSVPRASGDKPVIVMDITAVPSCSPRQRG